MVTNESMAVGERWAYREGAGKPLHEVVVAVIGAKSTSLRVKVEFLDDEFEGLVAWVPRGRLKCPWSEVAEFRAEEARWADLELDGRPVRGEADAASRCFEMVAPELIELYYNEAMGIGEISDAQQLARMLGWDVERLAASPGHHIIDGKLLVRWHLTREIAMTLARAHPARIRTIVDEERRSRRESIRTRASYAIERGWGIADAVDEARTLFRESGAEYWNRLARWIGYDDASVADDRHTLEVAYAELIELARAAVPELRSRRTLKAGHLADDIERAIGAPKRVGAQSATSPQKGRNTSVPDNQEQSSK